MPDLFPTMNTAQLHDLQCSRWSIGYFSLPFFLFCLPRFELCTMLVIIFIVNQRLSCLSIRRKSGGNSKINQTRGRRFCKNVVTVDELRRCPPWLMQEIFKSRTHSLITLMYNACFEVNHDSLINRDTPKRRKFLEIKESFSYSRESHLIYMATKLFYNL